MNRKGVEIALDKGSSKKEAKPLYLVFARSYAQRLNSPKIRDFKFYPTLINNSCTVCAHEKSLPASLEIHYRHTNL